MTSTHHSTSSSTSSQQQHHQKHSLAPPPRAWEDHLSRTPDWASPNHLTENYSTATHDDASDPAWATAAVNTSPPPSTTAATAASTSTTTTTATDDDGGGDTEQQYKHDPQLVASSLQKLLVDTRTRTAEAQQHDDFVSLSESHLFRRVLHPDHQGRMEGAEAVIEVIMQQVRIAIGEESEVPFSVDSEWDDDDDDGGGGDDDDDDGIGNRQEGLTEEAEEMEEQRREASKEQAAHFVRDHIWVIARFAFENPFAEVSKLFVNLVDWMESKGIPIPRGRHGFLSLPSVFISPVHLGGSVPRDKSVLQLFQEFFLEDGIVSHLPRMLAMHPAFCTVYYSTYNFLMKANGPLPLHWRNYIAIMAASRHNCDYLVRRQETEFLLNGGDPEWLKGLDHVPPKLANLAQFNAIVAHQPWLLNKFHVENLVTGQDAWSVAELVHAVTLMCHFHSLSGFVFGLGIQEDDETMEIDQVVDLLNSLKTQEDLEREMSEVGENQKVLEKLQRSGKDDDQEGDTEHAKSAEDKAKTFEKAEEVGSSSTADDGGESSVSLSLRLRSKENPSLKKYLGLTYEGVRYTDFDVRSKDYKIFPIHEYNWKDHAFSLLNRFYAESADLLDQEFDHIYTMTDRQFNQVGDVDTAIFRESIWYYVFRIYGMGNDYFDYRNINKFMNISLKTYIKMAACYPERVELQNFLNMGFQLRPSEKVHINLLTIEARKQLELVYAAFAIDRFLLGG